jgi:cytochrome P450
MSQLRDVARFAAQLYGAHAGVAWRGHVRRSPLARLELRAGRTDPYPLYDRLRSQALVPTALGNWASARHDVCSQVLRDRRFGVRMLDAPEPDGSFDLSFLERDPPDHTRLRRLAAPAFGARRMDGYRPMVQRTVDRVLDDAERSGTFDLVPTVAAALPVAVIIELLGVPQEEAGSLTHHGAVIGSALDGVRSLRHARALMASSHELEDMFARVFALRRREPGEDLVSGLLEAEGSTLTPQELVSMCTLLLIAGFETTVNLIGSGTLALLAHPDQWAALVAEPSLAATAVEEMLRYDAPVQRTSRVAHEDLELGGLPVRRGQVVLTLIGGANRDPGTFPAPGRFDITRQGGADNLAFSAGIHYCLGAPLARLEAVLLFTELARRLPGLRLAGRPTRRSSRTLRGPRSVPLSTR